MWVLSAHDDVCRSIRKRRVARKRSRGARRKRIPVRRRRQEFDALFRRARRQTSFSPSDMASIARRSPNGRRGSLYPTRNGPKESSLKPSQARGSTIILAYRWRTRLALDDAHLRLIRLMPKLSRSTLYRCLKHRGLSRIGPTATCPPLTTAALKGPYIFESPPMKLRFRDPDDVIGLGLPGPSRRRRDHERRLCGGLVGYT